MPASRSAHVCSTALCPCEPSINVLCSLALFGSVASQDSTQVPLPRHVYNVALEESLLLQAYRTLCGVYVGHQCPPVITMSSRNDILELAHRHLEPESYEAMVQYAASLDRHLNCDVVVDFPKPIGSLSPKATEAEQLAWHCLAEGSGSIWASVRSVVAKLPFDRDTRRFSKGFVCTLGLMAKRGAHGLTRHTGGHLNVCRLINQLVLAICPGLRWSSLTITLDNLCQPHTDMGNWPRGSVIMMLEVFGLRTRKAVILWRSVTSCTQERSTLQVRKE